MNRLYDASLIVIATIVGVCVLAGICSSYFFGDDNPVEQVAEKIIQEETGINVDLSP